MLWYYSKVFWIEERSGSEGGGDGFNIRGAPKTSCGNSFQGKLNPQSHGFSPRHQCSVIVTVVCSSG